MVESQVLYTWTRKGIDEVASRGTTLKWGSPDVGDQVTEAQLAMGLAKAKPDTYAKKGFWVRVVLSCPKAIIRLMSGKSFVFSLDPNAPCSQLKFSLAEILGTHHFRLSIRYGVQLIDPDASQSTLDGLELSVTDAGFLPQAIIDGLIAHMKDAGVEFGPGLTDQEIASAENLCSIEFPPDLRAFLSVAQPLRYLDKDNDRHEYFTDWRGIVDPTAAMNSFAGNWQGSHGKYCINSNGDLFVLSKASYDLAEYAGAFDFRGEVAGFNGGQCRLILTELDEVVGNINDTDSSDDNVDYSDSMDKNRLLHHELSTDIQGQLSADATSITWDNGVVWFRINERDFTSGPVGGVLFDVINRFWFDGWGPEPKTARQRLAIAQKHLRTVPRLIPITGNRFMTSEPQAGMPVLSMMQTDIIHYGSDLAHYFAEEFGFAPVREVLQEPVAKATFWGEINWFVFCESRQ